MHIFTGLLLWFNVFIQIMILTYYVITIYLCVTILSEACASWIEPDGKRLDPRRYCQDRWHDLSLSRVSDQSFAARECRGSD